MSTIVYSRFCALGMALFALLLTITLSGCAGAPERPAMSEDGLELMLNERDRFSYRKPGADFSGFERIQLLDASVTFKDNWLRDQNRNRRGNQRITEADAEAIQQNLSARFRDVFADELAKGGYSVVTETGPDVLTVKPAIVELDVIAPDIMQPGRTTTFVNDESGEATLQMELFDSESGQLLARTQDRRHARPPGGARRANSVTNRADADRVIRKWARSLRDGLDALRGN